MTIDTVLIIVALMVLGALIAYLGDLTGARLGKRRSTLFGMRPRRSARLIAAMIGALLPLIGLGVALLGSQYARIAVFQLRGIIQQRQQLTGEVADLKQQVADFERRVQTAEEHAATAEAEAASLLEAQADAQERITDLTGRRDELAGRVDDLSARRANLEGQLAGAQRELQAAQAGMQASEADLRTLEGDLTTTETELQAKREEVEERRLRVEQLSLEVDATGRELASAQGDLVGARQELEGAVDQLAQRQQELEEIESRLQQVERREVLVARADAIYEPGDELIRVVLPARETQGQMESDLSELLYLASAAAEGKGAAEGENGRAAVLVSPWPPWVTEGTREVPEAMIIRHVATELRTRGPAEWVVMVRAFRRLVADDRRQLAVEFKAAPNLLVFSAGEVIDEFTIGADATTLQAFERIWLRITGKTGPVRASAIAEGMLPHPETGNYGSVELADIFTAAEQVQAGEGMMRVRIEAAGDTYTRGPLLLDIKVAPDASP